MRFCFPITDHWSRLANKEFDEETKVVKLRELVPNNIWEFVAQQARSMKSYSELKELVLIQLTDPKTGMLRGERAPALHHVGEERND